MVSHPVFAGRISKRILHYYPVLTRPDGATMDNPQPVSDDQSDSNQFALLTKRQGEAEENHRENRPVSDDPLACMPSWLKCKEEAIKNHDKELRSLESETALNRSFLEEAMEQLQQDHRDKLEKINNKRDTILSEIYNTAWSTVCACFELSPVFINYLPPPLHMESKLLALSTIHMPSSDPKWRTVTDDFQSLLIVLTK